MSDPFDTYKVLYFKQFSSAQRIYFLFVYARFKVKRVLFLVFQFNLSTQFSFISPVDWTLSGTPNLSKSGPRSDGDKGVHCIPQSSSITGASSSDCLV